MHTVVLTMMHVYAALNFSTLVDLASPGSMSNMYDAANFRATWALTALDAGFWIEMKIKTTAGLGEHYVFHFLHGGPREGGREGAQGLGPSDCRPSPAQPEQGGSVSLPSKSRGRSEDLTDAEMALKGMVQVSAVPMTTVDL
ncbi:hypothetical protein B0H63DRAFT_529844 [Podospora didyma]|uniref:Uncharacterized protein n=1 Tax=Podospora didyma TaxID=330526 RepID=A0AAE0JYN0_9PEZI|nr:hypothetical protein B0H63DRAFT_529844 [Podospora didyma]